MTSGSSTEPRSPLFGTGSLSTFSATQSRTGYSSRSYSPSRDDPSYTSRTVSPTRTSHTSDTYSYEEENSLDETAEVEAALNELDDEFDSAQDALTTWSSSRGGSVLRSPQGYGAPPLHSYTSPATAVGLGGARLSRITERSESPSRPFSHNQSGTAAARLSSSTAETVRRSARNPDGSPTVHTRSATEPSAPPPLPSRRAGDLIAFFEERGADSPASGTGHQRTTSAPSGPRAPSPYIAGRSTPGYSSRPTSPTKSKGSSDSTVSSVSAGSISSLRSPPPMSASESRTGTNTYLSPSTFTNAYTNTNTSTFTPSSRTITGGFTTDTRTQPATIPLRRQQSSPRSPLTSVRNIVAAWKERTPLKSPGHGAPGSATSASPPGGDGLFSVRRRAERGSVRARGARDSGGMHGEPPPYDPTDTAGNGNGSGRSSTPLSAASSGLIPPPFDVAELGAYARGNAEPLRIGLLWYLNVHAPPPYRWQRCQALLYPHMLLLSWIAPGGGRGVVTLDLLNCTEVRSVPSPTHASARDDVGTVAAAAQAEDGLMELLCPFQLLYTDGVERLAAESARERVRWVSAIWEALDRSVTSIPDRSTTRSPTGSIRTIRSFTSSAGTQSESGSGSASTVFVPPTDTIPDISDLQSISGSSQRSGLTRQQSIASAHGARATDDAAVSSEGFLYPGDPRRIAPSRSSSLRRTSSLTDLDEEFSSAMNRARAQRPGLRFGLGLAGGVPLGDGSPVTISSGPRLGVDVRMTPPPSVGRGSNASSKSRSDLSLSDEAFFSAGASSGTRSHTSSSYSLMASRTERATGTRTTTGLITDETVRLTSDTGTNIVTSSLSLRNTDSASALGDSHSGSENSSYAYSDSSPSRSMLSRAREVRRRPRTSSRTYSSSYPEDSDKENSGSGSYTPTPSSDDYDVCRSSELSSFTRSDTPSYSSSYTPTSSSAPSTEQPPSTTYTTATSGTVGYDSAKSTASSSSSYVSLPTIPSESSYETAEVCSTEYVTATVCPTESEYTTAEICSTPPETEYWTAEPKDVDVESIKVPSEVPTIPSEIDPADIPLPPSTFTPSSVSSVEITPSITIQSISTETPSSLTPPSPAPPPSVPAPSPTVSLTEPSLTISASEPTPTARSVRTISAVESVWAGETDESYDSSILQASPSLRSLAAHPGPDISFETSFMRPTATEMSSLEPMSETLSIPSTTIPSPSPEASEPSSLTTPTPSSISSESSAPPSTVSRTPSTVSDVSYRSSVLDSRSLLDVPVPISEPSTEPSLLSSARSRALSPAQIPLPRSPSLPTPSVSMSVSMSTPESNVPSVRSDLYTISSTRSEILTHDINRILQHIHDLDQIRGDENREIMDNIRAIRDELYDLSDYLRAKDAPPVPHKDRPVGGSSTISSGPGGPRDQPAVQPHLVPIPLTPPPRIPSPSSMSSGTMSFLSSHHSDDLSLLDSVRYAPAGSPPYSSPSSSSSSSPSSESTELPDTYVSESSSTSGPYLSRTSSDASLPPRSPTPSSSSTATARPRDSLRDLLDRLRDQLAALWDGQISTNHMLDDLRSRAGPDNAEVIDRLRRIEDLLQGLPARTGRGRVPPSVETHYSDSSDGSVRRRIAEMLEAPLQPPLHAPTAIRPGGLSLDQQLADMTPPGEPSDLPPPPQITPFTYQARPRPRRSVTPLADLPPRSATAPPFRRAPVVFDRRPRPIPRMEPRTGPRTDQGPRDTPVISGPSDPTRQRPGEPDIDFLQRVQDLRQRRRPGTDGTYGAQPVSGRPGTAPPDMGGEDQRAPESWYRPPGAVPPPGTFGVPGGRPAGVPGAGAAYVPMPPGPMQVNVPFFDEVIDILRENRIATVATIDQQRELMRYMHSLNLWLGRDVEDRHNELRGVSARIDQLRNDLSRLTGAPPPQMPPGAMRPPGAGPGRPAVDVHNFPPGFQPLGPGGMAMPQPTMGVIPPVIPPRRYGDMGSRTPSPPFPPVIPGVNTAFPMAPPWGGTPGYGQGGPVIPPVNLFPGQPQDPYRRFTRSRSSSPETFIPEPVVVPPPGGIMPGPGGVTVVPPPQAPTTVHIPRSRSGSTTSTERTHDPGQAGVPYPAPLHDQGRPPRSGSRPSSDRTHRLHRSPSRSRSRSRSPSPARQTFIQVPGGTVPGELRAETPRHDIPAPIVVPPPQPFMTGVPGGVPGAPAVVMQPGQAPSAPPPQTVVVEGRSPSSRGRRRLYRSRSRSYSRSRSRSPSRPGVTVIPGGAPSQAPVVLPEHTGGGPIYVQSRRSRSRSSGRHTPPQVVIAGDPSRGRTHTRSHSPPVVVAPGTHAPGTVFMDRPSRSRSRSPRGRRWFGRSRSRSYSPGRYRGSRSRGRYRTYSPGRSRYYYESRSPSPRRRHHYRRRSRSRSPSYTESRSRSRSPRRRRRRRRSRSPRRRSRSVEEEEPERRPRTTRRRSRSRSPAEDYPEGISRRPLTTRPYSPPPTGRYSPPRTARSPPPTGRAYSPPRTARSPPPTGRAYSPPRTARPYSPPRTARPYSPRGAADYPEHDAGEAPHRIVIPHPRAAAGAAPTVVTYPGARPGDVSHPGGIPADRMAEEPAGGVPPTGYPPSAYPPEERPMSPRRPMSPIDDSHRRPAEEAPMPVQRVSSRARRPSQRPVTEMEDVAEDHQLHEEMPGVGTPYEGPMETGPATIPEVIQPVRSDTRRTRPAVTEAEVGAPLEHRPSRARRPSVSSVIPVPPRHGPESDEIRQRLGEVERDMLDRADRAAEEAEQHREAMFRDHETERERIFLEHEDKREQDALQRRDEVLDEIRRGIESRVPGVVHEPGLAPPVSGEPGRAPSVRESIVQAAHDAAGRHAADILETVRAEREELLREREAAEAERERIRAEAAEERARVNEEREARIAALEAELATTKAELENEKQMRATEETETRERERAENLERDDAFRAQLTDITDIVQDQRQVCAQKKELMDQRWEEKQTRRRVKEDQMQDLLDMVANMNRHCAEERERRESESQAAADKPSIETVISELRQQNQELREALNALSENWRADSTRQHEDTIAAVRATAQEQVPFNVQGYLDDFSKALASEVRMLLSEVGKLREEKRNLQHEMGYLLCMKSKYGPGGEFDPDWKPSMPGPPPPEPPPEPPSGDEHPPPAKPAWRSVHVRSARKQQKKPKQPEAPPAPLMPPMGPPGGNVRHTHGSWEQWHPDPHYAPSEASVPPNLVVPDRGSPGLFGPRSQSSR